MRLQQETLGSSILMTAPCRMGLSGHLVWYASKRSVQLILFLIFNLENYLFSKASPGRGSWSEEPVSALSAIQGLDTRGFLLPQRTRRERAWQASYLKNPSHSQEWMGKVLLSPDPTTTSLGDLGQACLPLSFSRRLPKQDKWPSSDIIPFKKPC